MRIKMPNHWFMFTLMVMTGPLFMLDRLHAAEKSPQSNSAAPNVIVILADDLGYGDVHCLNPERGKIATPHMDRLAAEGMTFTDGHSTSAVCTPSRYSLLTGRYNWRSKMQRGVLNGMSSPLIPSSRLTIASMVKQRGYATAAVGKWHLGMDISKPIESAKITNGPTAVGFDYYFGVSASLDMPPYAFIENDHFTEPPSEKGMLYKGRIGPLAPSFKAEDVLPTLGSKACEWIVAHKEKPFFLYLALTSPHTPLNPSVAWLGKSGMGSYADLVMETDFVVGEVMRTLDEQGLSKNTVLVLTSDNGCAPYVGTSKEVDPKMPHGMGDVKQLEEVGHYPSADRRGYKSDAWDGGHRVPFLVRWPQTVAPGSTCAQMVCQVDLMATVAELTGSVVPEDMGEDSFSFVPLLRGENNPVRKHLVHHSIGGQFAIREDNWKLICDKGAGGWGDRIEPVAKDAPDMQLYNMSEDVGERTNLLDKHPDIVERLKQALETMIANGRSTPGKKLKNDTDVEIIKKKKK